MKLKVVSPLNTVPPNALGAIKLLAALYPPCPGCGYIETACQCGLQDTLLYNPLKPMLWLTPLNHMVREAPYATECLVEALTDFMEDKLPPSLL